MGSLTPPSSPSLEMQAFASTDRHISRTASCRFSCLEEIQQNVLRRARSYDLSYYQDKVSLSQLKASSFDQIVHLIDKHYRATTTDQLLAFVQDCFVPNAVAFAKGVIERKLYDMGPFYIDKTCSTTQVFSIRIKVGDKYHEKKMSQDAFYDTWIAFSGQNSRILLALCLNSSKPVLKQYGAQLVEQFFREKGMLFSARPLDNEKIKEVCNRFGFCIRMSESSPLSFVPYIVKHGKCEQSQVISKDDFYFLYLKTGYSIEKIAQWLLDRHRDWTYESTSSYHIEIARSDIEKHPETVLTMLSERFSFGALFRSLFVRFKGEPAIDIGGVGRQFVSICMQKIVDTDRFIAGSNGFFLPRLASCESLQLEDKKFFMALGRFFGFCLKARGSYPTGHFFDPAFFSLLSSLLQKEVDIDDFDELFQHYSLLQLETKKHIEAYLKPSLADFELEELFDLLSGDPDLEGINRSNLIQNHDVIKKIYCQHVREAYILPFVYPVVLIAQGIKSVLPAAYSYDVPLLLQGVEGNRIDEVLFFSGVSKEVEETVRGWVQSFDDERRKLFIFAVTGSQAIASGKKIMVVLSRSIAFHTCSFQLDISRRLSGSALIEALDVALDVVKSDPRFDVV